MSGDDFLVSPSALDGDARVWAGWTDELGSVRRGVPLTVRDIDPLAFSVLNGAIDVMAAYSKAARALDDALGEGVEQLTDFSEKLAEIAVVYREAEAQNLADIKSKTSIEV